MGKKLLRLVLGLAYLAVLAVVFVASSYLAFNTFIQRGGTSVPSLSGLTLEQAERELGQLGLVLEHDPVRDRFSEERPVGQIVAQEPGSGALVKRGAGVEVVVSRGRQLVEVPDCRDQALPAAQVEIVGVGLTVERVFQVWVEEGLSGQVVRQYPPPGSAVLRGSGVDLFVVAGARREVFVMPDVVAHEYREVRAFFETRGLRVGSVKFERYEGVEEGTVLRQYPLAGHPLRRREVISLVVSAPEEETLGRVGESS